MRTTATAWKTTRGTLCQCGRRLNVTQGSLGSPVRECPKGTACEHQVKRNYFRDYRRTNYGRTDHVVMNGEDREPILPDPQFNGELPALAHCKCGAAERYDLQALIDSVTIARTGEMIPTRLRIYCGVCPADRWVTLG